MNKPIFTKAPDNATPRVREFRRSMIAEIPRWPNNRDSKQYVENCSLSELTLHFVSWQARFIPPRPRKVVIDPAVTYDYRFTNTQLGLNALVSRASTGANLTPHLSMLTGQRGFSPLSRRPGGDKWVDKDFMLTALGWHHFHLGTRTERKGHRERTGPILFAEIDRETFTAVSLSDHSAFVRGSPEALRLFELRQFRMASKLPAGQAYFTCLTATSGDPVYHGLYASHCITTMLHADPKLDLLEFLEEFYSQANKSIPKRPKLTWRFVGLDFGILDAQQQIFCPLAFGWM